MPKNNARAEAGSDTSNYRENDEPGNHGQEEARGELGRHHEDNRKKEKEEDRLQKPIHYVHLRRLPNAGSERQTLQSARRSSVRQRSGIEPSRNSCR